jgi:hypothetical protein
MLVVFSSDYGKKNSFFFPENQETADSSTSTAQSFFTAGAAESEDIVPLENSNENPTSTDQSVQAEGSSGPGHRNF